MNDEIMVEILPGHCEVIVNQDCIKRAGECIGKQAAIGTEAKSGLRRY